MRSSTASAEITPRATRSTSRLRSIAGVTATPGLNNTATITWTTDEPADSRVDYGLSASALDQSRRRRHVDDDAQRGAARRLRRSRLTSTRSTSADAAGNTASSAILSFTTPPTQFAATDTTVADFGAGTSDGQVSIAQTADGEVMLTPAAGSEFFGTSLPVDWSSTAWNAGGTAAVSGGALIVDGARAGTIANFGAGRSLEFVATFSGSPFQHVGLRRHARRRTVDHLQHVQRRRTVRADELGRCEHRHANRRFVPGIAASVPHRLDGVEHRVFGGRQRGRHARDRACRTAASARQ